MNGPLASPRSTAVTGPDPDFSALAPTTVVSATSDPIERSIPPSKITSVMPTAAVPNSWKHPDSWAEWRDIVIVFTALFWLIGGILLCAVLVAALLLFGVTRKVIKENAAPALDSLKQSIDNVRGTTEFAGETVASPIIRVYSVFKGVRTGVSAVTNLPDRIKRRKGKK